MKKQFLNSMLAIAFFASISNSLLCMEMDAIDKPQHSKKSIMDILGEISKSYKCELMMRNIDQEECFSSEKKCNRDIIASILEEEFEQIPVTENFTIKKSINMFFYTHLEKGLYKCVIITNENNYDNENQYHWPIDSSTEKIETRTLKLSALYELTVTKKYFSEIIIDKMKEHTENSPEIYFIRKKQ